MLDTFRRLWRTALRPRPQAGRGAAAPASKPLKLVVFEDFGEPLLALLGELAPARLPRASPGAGGCIPGGGRRLAAQATQADLRQPHARGVAAAWNVPPPFEADGHRQRVVDVLKRARLSVHLLDGYAGREVDGHLDPATTYPQEQVRLARDRARSQLIWVPRQLPEIDEAQQTLLDELRNGERGSARHHFHEGMPPSELVQDIPGPATAGPAAAERPRRCSWTAIPRMRR